MIYSIEKNKTKQSFCFRQRILPLSLSPTPSLPPSLPPSLSPSALPLSLYLCVDKVGLMILITMMIR